MTWFETSANETEADKAHVNMFVAVDFDFPSGHVRLWSGIGDLVIGGNTFTGAGALGHISMPAENVRQTTERKTYQLTGVDPTLVSESDIDGSFGRTVLEYFGFLTDAGVLVATPELNWEGRIDQINRVDGDNPVIEVNAEHRMVMLDQSSGLRYTDQHQQAFFPGDNGLKPVAAINMKTVVWGGTRVVVGQPYTPQDDG